MFFILGTAKEIEGIKTAIINDNAQNNNSFQEPVIIWDELCEMRKKTGANLLNQQHVSMDLKELERKFGQYCLQRGVLQQVRRVRKATSSSNAASSFNVSSSNAASLSSDDQLMDS